MFARRKFLRMIGFAPIAGKAAAEQLAGVGIGDVAVFGSGISAPRGGYRNRLGGPGGVPASSGLSIGQRMLKFFAGSDMPDFVMDRIIAESKHVHRLDPDLAVNKSFSLCTKMRIQSEREVPRVLETIRRQNKNQIAREDFYNKYGFELL
jgi:hypothetical protein